MQHFNFKNFNTKHFIFKVYLKEMTIRIINSYLSTEGVFHSFAKDSFLFTYLVFHSHARKIMLKIVQASLQYVNQELPDVQAGFRKSRGTKDQIANICWIIEKAREFQKNIYFCFIDYIKAFDYVDHREVDNS